MKLFTVPPEVPFLDALAEEMLRGGAERLADTLVLLPSRRAYLALRDTFLRLTDGKPLLLPCMQPVGEVEGDEIVLDGGADLELPPAIDPLRRHLLLTRLVLARPNADGSTVPHEQAVRLAADLAAFLDETQNEEVGLDALDGLVREELAEHWKRVLAFLDILRVAWPGVLAAERAVDPARHRTQLLHLVAERWSRQAPPHPVVAAGITGSIPAVARLLEVVAGLPDGAVVLPGLDRDLDEASWTALGPTHPQFALKRLLEKLQVERLAVRPWPTGGAVGGPPERTQLWREVMRPAATSEAWRRQAPASAATLQGLEVASCGDLADEALQIALRLREAVETPGRRAALVTPDRNLARRVAAELGRWDLRADDSAGIPLDQSPPGTFLLLTAHLLVDAAPPVTLLAALKHPLAGGGLGRGELRRRVRALERSLLRGPRTAGGFDGLIARLDDPEEQPHWPYPLARQVLRDWLAGLREKARPMTDIVAAGSAPFRDLIDRHLAFASALAADDTGDDAELWKEEAGSVMQEFVSALRATADVLDTVPASAYPALLAVLMGQHQVRPRAPAHPRLAILGQLESRLVQADLVLIGGLVEGVWPRAADGGPWLNREMRRKLGLPPAELQVGIAAHDLVMAASAPDVVLSRALKDEGGSPTTTSRWLSRLEAVLAPSGGLAAVAAKPEWRHWAERLDAPTGPVRPWPRPRPTPPVEARPRQLSASDIQKLMRDPYSIYARKILELRPIDDLDADPGAAERGELIHAAIEKFVRAWPVLLPNDPYATLVDIGAELFEAQAHRPQVMAIWWPRFLTIARWFTDMERERRAEIDRVVAEIRGELEFDLANGKIKILARADRIERRRDGKLGIIDYKTGTLPTKNDVDSGRAPQLPIEALIARAGGFAAVGAGEVAELAYWRLRGGDPAGEERDVSQTDLQTAADGLRQLLEHFDKPTVAYRPAPYLGEAIDSDYEHLERFAEWNSADKDG